MNPIDPPHLPRRGFFRKALRESLAPLADLLGSTSDPRKANRPSVLLRPPGAISEDRFADVCHRCGACVRACPAHAILPSSSDAAGKGTPVIDADTAACVVCDGLLCTHVCPSGALLPVMKPQDIQMGLAEVYATLCVRSHDESCTLCVDRCPLGASAIRFEEGGPPRVLPDGCVGCGVCQLYCPTTPKAIVVLSQESR